MRKKQLKDENGLDLYEVEAAEWYAIKGKLPPEKWNWNTMRLPVCHGLRME